MFKNETTPDTDMQPKLESIAQQIEMNFTPDAKKFYERVFAFSDQLTKVSDIIKVYPKGNERKEGMNKIIVFSYAIMRVLLIISLYQSTTRDWKRRTTWSLSSIQSRSHRHFITTG